MVCGDCHNEMVKAIQLEAAGEGADISFGCYICRKVVVDEPSEVVVMEQVASIFKMQPSMTL